MALKGSNRPNAQLEPLSCISRKNVMYQAGLHNLKPYIKALLLVININIKNYVVL